MSGGGDWGAMDGMQSVRFSWWPCLVQQRVAQSRASRVVSRSQTQHNPALHTRLAVRGAAGWGVLRVLRPGKGERVGCLFFSSRDAGLLAARYGSPHPPAAQVPSFITN